MKKTLILTLASVMLFSSTALARIVIECDNYNDTVNYRSYKTIGAYGISEYAFIKTTKENTPDKYYLRLAPNYRNNSSRASRYLTGKTCKVIVDGKTFNIPKVTDGSNPRPHEMYSCALPFAFYQFTTEAITAMQNAKDIQFLINTPGKEDTHIIVNESNRNEFQRMYKLQFADYISDKNINEGL